MTDTFTSTCAQIIPVLGLAGALIGPQMGKGWPDYLNGLSDKHTRDVPRDTLHWIYGLLAGATVILVAAIVAEYFCLSFLHADEHQRDTFGDPSGFIVGVILVQAIVVIILPVVSSAAYVYGEVQIFRSKTKKSN